MRALVALGNPGPQYEFTRHNYGWLVADQIEDRSRVKKRQKTPSYVLIQATHRGTEFLICRPQTYMNDSGIAVANLLKASPLEIDDLIVMHDDLDIPFGTIKLKIGGGHAGHKGLISILRELGRDDFARLRLGIGCEPKPHDGSEYVLQPFGDEQIEILENTIGLAVEAALDAVAGDIKLVMNTVNRREKEKEKTPPPPTSTPE
jgi:PTH1 family peptidyl-tRNA hydrolase